MSRPKKGLQLFCQFY